MVDDQPSKLAIKYKYNRVECPEPVEGQFYFYILECKDHSLYCGSSNNLQERLVTHNSGKAAGWTIIRRPVQLAYYEVYQSLLEARRREKQIKGWTKIKKENLINGKWGKP